MMRIHCNIIECHFINIYIYIYLCCKSSVDHIVLFTLPHRRLKMERMRKRKSRQRMERRKKKEEENLKERGRQTKQSLRWVQKGFVFIRRCRHKGFGQQ